MNINKKTLRSILQILLILCVSPHLLAQSPSEFDLDENLPKIITEPERKVKFNISSDENLHITPEKDLYYHSFKHNKIFITQGGYDGTLLNGKYTEFFPNENLKESGYFKNGLKDGIWTEWYKNGNIKTRSEWKNGRRNGLSEEYSEEGKLVKKMLYANSQLHGQMIWYKADTTIISNYKNGVLLPPSRSRKK